MSVSVSVCECLCVCVHDNLKDIGSIYIKLKHIAVHENISDEFDIGHHPVKVTERL